MSHPSEKYLEGLLILKDKGLDDHDLEKAFLLDIEKLEAIRKSKDTLTGQEEGRFFGLLHIVRRLEKTMPPEAIAPWLRREREDLWNKSPLCMLGPEVEKLISLIKKECRKNPSENY